MVNARVGFERVPLPSGSEDVGTIVDHELPLTSLSIGYESNFCLKKREFIDVASKRAKSYWDSVSACTAGTLTGSVYGHLNVIWSSLLAGDQADVPLRNVL